jgi:hypothetical protein
MRPAVNVLVLLLILVVAAGLILAGVGRVRREAALTQCRNNLRQIGMAFRDHHDVYRHFPTGTVPNPTLPPDKRLGWVPQVWTAFMCGGVKVRLDRAKAWDAGGNCPPWWTFRVDDEGNTRTDLVGELTTFWCPATPSRYDPGLPSPMHYLGLAGVGDAAGELPLGDPRAGFFGYDRTVTRADVKDGLATTVAVIESADGGPWTAGGRATVRGLAGDRPPYLGEGGQFRANHGGLTNVLFSDASVRPLADGVSPGVLEALATIAGGEQVSEDDY